MPVEPTPGSGEESSKIETYQPKQNFWSTELSSSPPCCMEPSNGPPTAGIWEPWNNTIKDRYVELPCHRDKATGARRKIKRLNHYQQLLLFPVVTAPKYADRGLAFTAIWSPTSKHKREDSHTRFEWPLMMMNILESTNLSIHGHDGAPVKYLHH